MLRFYRGHIIITLVDQRLSAEITERSTGVPFALKVSASMEEGEAVLFGRARHLIDIPLRQVGSAEWIGFAKAN
jgi:hypothetical protein